MARQENKSKDYANKCAQKSGKDLLANAGTRDVVKDMDVLRQVLGDMAGGGLSSEEFERAKGHVKGSLVLGLEDPGEGCLGSESPRSPTARS